MCHNLRVISISMCNFSFNSWQMILIFSLSKTIVVVEMYRNVILFKIQRSFLNNYLCSFMYCHHNDKLKAEVKNHLHRLSLSLALGPTSSPTTLLSFDEISSFLFNTLTPCCCLFLMNISIYLLTNNIGMFSFFSRSFLISTRVNNTQSER